MIRDALPSEMDEVGDIRVAAYQAGGFLSADSGYAPTLRGLGADGSGPVLVALDGDAILGTVMLQVWPHTGQTVAGPHEAELRALAVRPQAQGKGIGRELLQVAIERAAELGVGHLVLCTEPEMRPAHRLYEQAGFTRLPERDWSPAPDVRLLVYGLALPALEPGHPQGRRNGATG
jgi:ribosomal protein S18 acetylase RimI-like enzyme